MRIVELRRTGAGTLEETLNKFEWSGPQHSAMQGTLDLELEAKTVRKEMPGSNEVVEQGLSATWKPFDMHGEWDDKWAGQGFAMQMYNDLAPFVARFPLVQFTLDQHSLTGIITSLKITYQKASKIGWAMTMSPHTNDTFTEATLQQDVIEHRSIEDWWKQFSSYLDGIMFGRSYVRGMPLKTGLLAKFDTLIANVNDAITKVGDIATHGLESDTQRRLLQVASTFRRVRGAGLDVLQGIQRQTNTLDAAYQDVMQTLNYHDWVNNTQVALWRMVGVSRLAEIDMIHRLGLKPKAIYRPKPRESLERISTKFYGTPDNAMLIYDTNNLKSAVFVGTEELFIPELA